MIRLFWQHTVRKQMELDGIWKFVREDGKTYSLPVPGCWEQHPDMTNFRGRGSYRKRIQITKKTNLRLEFKGVSHTADVYFDDVFLTHHYNAFTPFSTVVREVEPGEHTIRVEVDNTFGEHSALHVPNDYYTYGGIIRPVSLEEIENTYIENVHFCAEKKDGVWYAEISARIKNIGARAETVEIAGKLAGQTIEAKTCAAEPGKECLVQWNAAFEDVEEWNPETPKLYMLTLYLKQGGAVYDDYIDRVGFRTVEVDGSRLCVNGRRVFLKGFNRHEDHGAVGCAIPPQLMIQDMDIMQDLGANAVRTCHYPNDERFLDLCDERGILVWEENHARGFDLKKMQNPNFEKQCEDCISEMIEKHYNHPSVVIWGILNECASEEPQGREMYRRQYEQIRSLDTSRPTTSATCRHFTDRCLDLPDIVSFNIYSGWYENDPVKERHERELNWIAAAGGAGKPVIVSEFGAGAIYGFRDRRRCKWSEERQGDILGGQLEVYGKDNRLSGVFIWQFADCRITEENGWFAGRPKCQNNKGIVDEFRRPKLAYDVVKKYFAET